MAEHDLGIVLPDQNGVRVCDMAIGELSRQAVAVVDDIERGAQR